MNGLTKTFYTYFVYETHKSCVTRRSSGKNFGRFRVKKTYLEAINFTMLEFLKRRKFEDLANFSGAKIWKGNLSEMKEIPKNGNTKVDVFSGYFRLDRTFQNEI